MEYLPDFKVLRPDNLADAIAAHAASPNARYLAGGTDLLVNMRRGIVDAGLLIDLSGIADLTTIRETADGGLRIGTGVTLARLATEPQVTDPYPAIRQAANLVAATSHREVATLGGNLCLDTRCVYYNQSEWWRNANAYCLKYRGDVCHVAPSGKTCFAAFSGDLAPAMLIYGAMVEIVGPDGRRTVPLDDIYQEDGMAYLRLMAGEILCAVILDRPGPNGSGYAKVRVRDAIDFPLVGIAMLLSRDGDRLRRLQVALTGTNARPLLLDGTEGLTGQPFDDTALDQLVDLVSRQIQPMTSTFTPPGYRRRVAANLTRALAKKLMQATPSDPS